MSPPHIAYITRVDMNGERLLDWQLDLRFKATVDLAIDAGTDVGTVEGIVRNEAGEPMSATNVTLVPDQSDPNWRTRWRNMSSDNRGKFRFGDVIPGEYVAFAWDGAERGAPQSAEFRKGFGARGVKVTVPPRGLVTLSLKSIDVSGVH